jgi:hypothetical protein
MDSMSYRNNRPVQRANEPEEPASRPTAASASTIRTKQTNKSGKRFNLPLKLGLIVLVVLLVAAGAWYVLGRGGASSAIDGGKYQAVFFTNGQVYFGKLTVVNNDYMRLSNVYYLQSKTTSSETTPQSASKQDNSDVELIKLGNEIHGPDDEMIIAKDQVLFFENLKSTGTVSKTILDYQKNQKN